MVVNGLWSDAADFDEAVVLNEDRVASQVAVDDRGIAGVKITDSHNGEMRDMK